MFLLMMADTLRKDFFINAFFMILTSKKTRRENIFYAKQTQEKSEFVFSFLSTASGANFSLKAEFFVRSAHLYAHSLRKRKENTQRIPTVGQ